MKKQLRLCAAYLLSLGMIFPVLAADGDAAESTVSDPAPFSDISGHWAEDVITRWQSSGIVNGYPDGTFKPDNPITRAELAKIITLAFGLEDKTESALTDVDSGDWYYDYVLTAIDYIPSYSPPDANEITNAYRFLEKGTFLPENQVLRFHAAETFSLLKTERDGTEVEKPSIQDIHYELIGVYKDVEFCNLYATMHGIPENVVRFQTYPWLAYKLGIMEGAPGEDGNYFLPYNSLTRAEVLTILDRILEPENIS